MSVYDILTMSWIGVTASEQVIAILDTVFDIVQLILICVVSGVIVDTKTDLLESITLISKDCMLMTSDLGHEIQFFVSIVGHSKMAMTAANIFPLNKNLAVTLLGVIVSYSVVIYQVSK
ncbi:uncharacterized protein TNIN_152671 [Trichonephila inaurata madagascariensis]|uniref:Uncharacterized protein n=1 Tax=Trichonephila inaurata madagascariensis TaxID=2747483 RepID=A0A8X6WP01_9ARAC|nr:uncharacterized protein TNIN_152671 [Trichonephila inaurata madagascariensis]